VAGEGSLGASHFTKVPMSSTDECRFAVRYKMNDFVDMVSLSWISKQTQHMSLSLSLSLYIYIYVLHEPNVCIIALMHAYGTHTVYIY